MRPKMIAAAWPGCLAALLICWWLGARFAAAADANMKFEVQLVWGTDADQSPDPKHKEVEPEILKKFKELHLKWNHYFEVSRKPLEVAPNGTTKQALSDKCEIGVKSLGKSTFEFYVGKKEKDPVKHTQSLPKGEVLILSGNAPNDTSWFVVLKRLE